MAEKVRLPKEVAEAIENRRDDSDPAWGMKLISNIWSLVPNAMSQDHRVIYDWVHDSNDPKFKNLLSALVNGYDIEPEYVSFEEAMKELKKQTSKGAHVELHNAMGDFKIETSTELEDLYDLTLHDLLYGDWTIEGDDGQ